MTLTAAGRSITVLPTQALVGHVGTLKITAPGLPRAITLDFEERGPFLNRTPWGWAARYAGTVASGMRDVLLALRDNGVALHLSTGARASVGANRFGTWVAAVALIGCELVLFVIPAGVIGQLISGERSVGSPATTAVVGALLVVFLVLAVATSRFPLVIRRSLDEVEDTAADPVAYLEARAWMNEYVTLSALLAFLASRSNSPESGGTNRSPQAQRVPAFMPGVPLLRSGLLLGAIVLVGAIYAFRGRLDAGGTAAGGETAESGRPDWLTTDTALLIEILLTLLALAVTFGLIGAWVVTLVRSRRGQGAARHVLLLLAAGGLVVLAGLREEYGSSGLSSSAGEVQMISFHLGALVLLAVIAWRKWLLAGLVSAATVAAFLVADGAFDGAARVGSLVGIIALIAAIIWRYLPGGAYVVPMAADRSARLARIVLAMAIAKWLIGAVLVIGFGRTLLA